MDRRDRLVKAFVQLTDTLVAEFDVVELAERLIGTAMALLPVDAAGIMLVDADSNLRVPASSSGQTHLLELLQIRQNTGPCLQAYRTGKPVTVENLRVDGDRWPQFTTRAVEYGLMSVQAFPLRLRSDRLGALNLLRGTAGRLDDADLAIGQALADVATIGILHQRVATRLDLLNQQLQSALDTRMVIEQAKGILAARGGIDVDRAFHLLRTHARMTGIRLVDAARAVVQGGDTTTMLADG